MSKPAQELETTCLLKTYSDTNLIYRSIAVRDLVLKLYLYMYMTLLHIENSSYEYTRACINKLHHKKLLNCSDYQIGQAVLGLFDKFQCLSGEAE